MEDRIDTLEIGMEGLQHELGLLQRDIHSLQHDVRLLQDDVRTLQRGVHGMQQDFNALQHDVKALGQQVQLLAHDVKSLQLNVNALQQDTAVLKVDVAYIRSHYATFADLERFKNEISAALHALDQKVSILTQRFDSELGQFVTKAELQRELRLWVGGSAIALFFGIAGINFALFSALKH